MSIKNDHSYLLVGVGLLLTSLLLFIVLVVLTTLNPSMNIPQQQEFVVIIILSLFAGAGAGLIGWHAHYNQLVLLLGENSVNFGAAGGLATFKFAVIAGYLHCFSI